MNYIHDTQFESKSVQRELNMQYSMVDDVETLDCLTTISSPELNNGLKMENLIDHPEALRLKREIEIYKEEILYLDQKENMMQDIAEQFKTTISELILTGEKDRVYHDIEKDRIDKEKSQIIEDLIAAEHSYNDVKGKYDRIKDLISRYQYGEDNLKNCLKEKSDKLKQKEQNFERLKRHAEDKVNQANEAIIEITNIRDIEIARLTTMLRKSELRVETLDDMMKQKSEESRELAKMCDELINCSKSKPSFNFSM